MGKKCIVRLTSEEREGLKALVAKGRASARKIGRAQVLLKVDVDRPNWTERQVAEAFGIRANTVADIRERFVEKGLARALDRKRPDASSEAPKARWRWRGNQGLSAVREDARRRSRPLSHPRDPRCPRALR